MAHIGATSPIQNVCASTSSNAGIHHAAIAGHVTGEITRYLNVDGITEQHFSVRRDAGHTTAVIALSLAAADIHDAVWVELHGDWDVCYGRPTFVATAVTFGD